MKTSKTSKALALIALLASALVGQRQNDNSSSNVTERQVKGINLNQVMILNAATSALNAANVPGGIVTISGCGEAEAYNLTPVGQRLRDILDSITIADPRYQWQVDHDLVNLVQSDNEPTLLDIVISDFNVEPNQTEFSIVEGLLNLPEVKTGIVKLRLNRGPREIGLRSLERPGSPKAEDSRGFAIHLRNITVSEALNAAARAHGNGVWRYNERRCNATREFSIQFLGW